VKIHLDKAEVNIRDVVVPDPLPRTGYPKKFGNREGIAFASACTGKTLLEFPVYTDGHLWKKREDPLIARVIFTDPGKVLCGIIGHPNAKKDHDRSFKLCE